MSTYELLLALHILAAVMWVGGGVGITIMGARAQASGDGNRMLHFAQDAHWIGPRFFAPLSLLLLVAGILLVSETPYEHSDTWVMIGYAGWLISFAIGIGYYSRAGAKQLQIVEREGIGSPAFTALYNQVKTVNYVEMAILLLVVADMAIKPGS